MPGLASDDQAFLAQEPLPEHTASTAFTTSIASKTRTETTTKTAMTIPDDELEKIEEWCKEDLVSLPFASLPASDGMIDPFTDSELQELQQHLHSAHLKKTNLCRGCLESEKPRKLHRTVREFDRATHTLHIDIAGPFTVSDDFGWSRLSGSRQCVAPVSRIGGKMPLASALSVEWKEG